MKIIKSNANNPITFCTCGNLISPDGFLHHKRNFDVCVFILVLEGTLFITQDGTSHEIESNQFIILKDSLEHYGTKPSIGKLSYLWVHFLMPQNKTILDKKELESLNMENKTPEQTTDMYLPLYLPELGIVSSTKKIPVLFRQLLDYSRQTGIYAKQLQDYTLNLLLTEISQDFISNNQPTESEIPTQILRVMDWIQTNYYNPISIPLLGKEFGYHPDYLSHLFHQSTGSTIIQFINKTRIDSSKNLLANYQVSIKEAAYSCGYIDEKYYMKLFQKQEGITPSQFKNTYFKKI